MASIYDQQDAQNFIERINKLNPISQHIWGTMTVAQMLAHIQQPIRVALGEYKPKRTIIGILFGIGMAALVTLSGALTAVITYDSILLAFTFALGIGVFFGLYPAFRAANLTPMVALRYE